MFANLVKALGKTGSKGSVAREAMRMIDTFYHYEKQFKDMSPDERLTARQDKIAPLVDVFFEWIKKMVDQVGSKAVRDGLHYCINREKYLRVFLTEMVETRIDRNNLDKEKIQQILPRLLPWSDAIPDICRMK